MPACFGFAIISSHVANVVLGPEFRSLASEVMPIISMAVIFQIMTYQYLHISFLLAERNAFYLLNTGSVLVFNAVVSYGLILQFGAIGAAWARLAAEIFGFAGALLLTRWAFRIPLSLKSIASVLSATIVMSIVLRFLDMNLAVTDKDALIILISVGCVDLYGGMLDPGRCQSEKPAEPRHADRATDDDAVARAAGIREIRSRTDRPRLIVCTIAASNRFK